MTVTPFRWRPARPARPALVVLTATFGGRLCGQATTGVVTGIVVDDSGVAVAGARLIIEPTEFSASTNADGRFAFDVVPSGTYTLRIRGVGRAPDAVPDLRVNAGQLLDLRVVLPGEAAQAGAVGAASVRNLAPGPPTTRIDIDAAGFTALPLTDVREVLDLQGGIVETDDPWGLSVRGSPPGDAGVYIDGALVRSGRREMSSLLLGTNAILDATVTTGALAADVPEGQSGAISFVTSAGTSRFRGALRYRTDDVGVDAWRNIGLHRLEASVGGPWGGRSSFFTAVTLTGRQSLETQKLRDVEAPVYVASGVDTIVRQPATVGDPTSDTMDVGIPRFVQYSGYCDPSRNFDAGCRGLRLPFTVNGSLMWQGKLRHAYGTGSLISLTALAGESQQRVFPGVNLYDPAAYAGVSRRGSALILQWIHGLATLRGAPVTLDVNFSRQKEDRVTGPLTPQAEADTRQVFWGFLIAPLRYQLDFNSTHDVTIASRTFSRVGYLDDLQIQCLQAGTAYCGDDVPLPDRNDLLAQQPYRSNPYAVEQDAALPLWTQGLEVGAALERVRDWAARAGLAWRPGRGHRVRVGADVDRFDTRRYAVGSLISPFGIDLYHERPVRLGGYAEDRLRLGRLLIVGGVRWDRFDSRARYPVTPGRISTDTLPFDPDDPAAAFVRAASHSAWSPRLQASVAVSGHLRIRMSAARQVQMPAFEALFRAKNTDLTLTSTAQVFGRDLGLLSTTLVELGVHDSFASGTAVDLAAYEKRVSSGTVIRAVTLPDPFRAGASSTFFVYADRDFGTMHGAEITIEQRVAGLFSSELAYSYQNGRPPYADRASTLAGSAMLALPAQWRAGTLPGSLLQGTVVVATVRLTSGARYTGVQQYGAGTTTDGGGGLPIEPFNASVLPSFRTMDVRVRRAFALGAFRASVFVEATNLFDFTNVLGRFTETDDVVNDLYEARFVTSQTQRLLQEAMAAGVATSDANGRPAVDLSTPGVCTRWAGRNTPGSYSSGPADCVLLQRAERRFGNGDGVYTESEFTRAFTAWYDLANAPYRFYGPGRRLRVGVDIVF